MDQFFNMFNELNKQLFNALNDAVKDKDTIEFKLPNGSVYRFSGNIFSEEQFQDLKKQLEEAANMNHKEKFEEIMRDINEEVQKGMKEFSNEFNSMDLNKLFESFQGFGFQMPNKSEVNSVDEQIKKHEAEIARLKKMKEANETKAQKAELEKELAELKAKLDEKLDELNMHKDNEEMKKNITAELISIQHEIREVEAKLSEF